MSNELTGIPTLVSGASDVYQVRDNAMIKKILRKQDLYIVPILAVVRPPISSPCRL